MAKAEVYPYPSHFGSYSCMVVKDNEDGTVSCHDEFGDFVTDKNRIDSNLADPNRYKESRIQRFFHGRKEETH